MRGYVVKCENSCVGRILLTCSAFVKVSPNLNKIPPNVGSIKGTCVCFVLG